MKGSTIPAFVASALTIHCDKALEAILSYAESHPEPDLLSGLCKAANNFEQHTDDAKISSMQSNFRGKLNQIIINTSVFTIETRNVNHLNKDYFIYALQLPDLQVKSEYDLISSLVFLAKGFVSDQELQEYEVTLAQSEEAVGDDEDAKRQISENRANAREILTNNHLEDLKKFLKFDSAQGVYQFEAKEFYSRNSASTCSTKRTYVGFTDSQIEEQIKHLVRIDDYTITVMLEEYEKNLPSYLKFLAVVEEVSKVVPYSLRIEFRHFKKNDMKDCQQIIDIISKLDLELALCFDYRDKNAFKETQERPNDSVIYPPDINTVKTILEIIKRPKCLSELDLRGFNFVDDEIFKAVSTEIPKLPNLDVLEIAHYQVKKGFEYTFLGTAVAAKVKDVRLIYPKRV